MMPAGNWYPKITILLIEQNGNQREIDESKKTIEEIIVETWDTIPSDPKIFVAGYHSESFEAEIKSKKITQEVTILEIGHVVCMEVFDDERYGKGKSNFKNLESARYFIKFSNENKRFFLIIKGKGFKKEIEFVLHKGLRQRHD